MPKVFAFLETLAVALAGVALFSMIHIPLPWLIGSLVAVAAWRILLQRELFWLSSFQKIAMVLLGYLTGTSFTKETLVQMGDHIPSMIAVTLLTIGFSLLLGWFFSKLTGLDLASCMIGAIPGGLSQIMVLLDEIKGLNPTIIMFLQSMRVMMIVIVVPITAVYLFGGGAGTAPGAEADTISWLAMPWYTYLLYPLLLVAAAWLFSRLRVPAPMLLGPMVLTIALTFTSLPVPDLPTGLVGLAQLFIGVHIGLQMQPRDLPGWKRIMAYTIIMIIVIVLFGFVLGTGLALIYDVPYTTALLSTTPGGMVEMGLTAAGIGADISVVTSYQLFRLLLIMVFVPFFFRWLGKRRAGQ
ncbi:AbrB family transcriptional regulator [Barrientosiimonas marina]|uniref:AbrB family transcriptional regulator n=1 Tax=Lentibacillus kimchii TaxID=1542911 RepID=A0ABW2UWE5_9BACI